MKWGRETGSYLVGEVSRQRRYSTKALSLEWVYYAVVAARRGPVWLTQNMRRNVVKDELAEVTEYLYHFMKGLLGSVKGLLNQVWRHAHWAILSGDGHILPFALLDCSSRCGQSMDRMRGLCAQAWERVRQEEPTQQGHPGRAPYARCWWSGQVKTWRKERMEGWGRDDSKLLGSSHWDEWWCHLLSWWTWGQSSSERSC